jgi:septal ring factor EnvC (AmiA/AmiB activator)
MVPRVTRGARKLALLSAVPPFATNCLALALLLAPATSAQNDSAAGDALQEQVQRESAELVRIREELERARAETEEKAEQETKILSTLNRIDSELALKERLLAGLERKEKRLAADLESTRRELLRARADLQERRDVLRRRLRNIYIVGEKPGLQVLLGASSAVDLVRRFDWLLLVANQDKRLVEGVQESLVEVREVEAELALKMDEVRGVRSESEKEKSELVRSKDDRSALLRSIRSEKEHSRKVVLELEQAEKEVQKVLADLERKAREPRPGTGSPLGGTSFAASKGKLPWPVKGDVTRWFGVQKDKRFGTSTFNGGIDIRAEREADVIAVHEGRADYVDWLPGYGQCIILSHGDGYYTLYAHTSRVFVSPGDLVKRGDVIATVGDTGSLVGDVLHFEIRKDAEPVNPAPWLQATRLR